MTSDISHLGYDTLFTIGEQGLSSTYPRISIGGVTSKNSPTQDSMNTGGAIFVCVATQKAICNYCIRAHMYKSIRPYSFLLHGLILSYKLIHISFLVIVTNKV